MPRIGVVHFQNAPIHRLALLVIEQLVQREPFRHVLEEQSILLFARAQRLLGPLALGDVLAKDGEPDDPTTVAKDRISMIIKRPAAPLINKVNRLTRI